MWILLCILIILLSIILLKICISFDWPHLYVMYSTYLFIYDIDIHVFHVLKLYLNIHQFCTLNFFLQASQVFIILHKLKIHGD